MLNRRHKFDLQFAPSLHEEKCRSPWGRSLPDVHTDTLFEDSRTCLKAKYPSGIMMMTVMMTMIMMTTTTTMTTMMPVMMTTMMMNDDEAEEQDDDDDD
jgi:hypothetical protein